MQMHNHSDAAVEPVPYAGGYWLTVADQASLLRWAAPRCGVRNGWLSDSQAMGATRGRDGPLKIVGVLNCFHDQGAWIHLAADGAAPRPVLGCIAPILYHAFCVLGLRRLTARIPVENVAAQMLALRAGFTVEGRERAALDSGDIAIFAMLREDAAWLHDEGEF